jgi:uncharacterized protein
MVSLRLAACQSGEQIMVRMTAGIRWGWLALTLWCAHVLAGPYDVVVGVVDESPAAREAAAREALATVLPKQTGLRDPLEKSAVAALLANASQWVQQYDYLRGPDDANPFRLHLVFDQKGFEQALQKVGVPLWGSKPSLLMLVRFEVPGGGSRMVGVEETALKDLVTAQAQQRGVSVVFPLLDLEDQALLTTENMDEPAEASLLALAQRYGCQMVWSGRVRAEQGQWRGDWRVAGEHRVRWDDQRADPEAVVREGVDAALDRWVAARQSLRKPIMAGAQSAVTVWVSDVRHLGDYWHLMEALRQVPGVADVRLAALAPERIGITLRTALATDALIGLLSTRGRFEAEGLPEGLAAPTSVGMRWQP